MQNEGSVISKQDLQCELAVLKEESIKLKERRAMLREKKKRMVFERKCLKYLEEVGSDEDGNTLYRLKI